MCFWLSLFYYQYSTFGIGFQAETKPLRARKQWRYSWQIGQRFVSERSYCFTVRESLFYGEITQDKTTRIKICQEKILDTVFLLRYDMTCVRINTGDR